MASQKTPGRKSTKRQARKKAPVKKLTVAREEGPRGWFLPILESAYTRLVPRDQAETGTRGARTTRGAATRGAFRSHLQPDRGEEVLAPVPQDLWRDRLAEYQRRKGAAAAGRPRTRGPAVPGERNWAPLGPSVVLGGQAHGLPPVGGRISGIAVAAGGQTVYAASANGGVFRSDDGGVSWRSLMDAFDMDPTHFASTSLACGAIAIDAADPERIYVGTGEGDTHQLFDNRIVNSLPAYRGIGPIRSDDGGETWLAEPTAAGSPDLAGKAFFALAVDPSDRENVVGATTEGLYQRVTGAGGAPEWVQCRPGVHSSVVVAAAGGTTRFFAAEWSGGVFQSTDGTHWSAVGTGFPTANVGRIALGVQPDNPDLVYALVANRRGALLGVFRLGGTGAWKRISSPPDVLPAEDGNGQGDYDLAIAVDPQDAGWIYLGGSYFDDGQLWPASVWRCRVQASGTGFRMTGEPIGLQAHADVHVLVHTPGEPDELWVGCDGGVFLNRDPRGSGLFKARNNGLACLCTNFFAQHPTDPGVLFCGLQDNGTARASGGPIWNHVNWGDGGYCLINWADPRQVLVFANGTVYRATDGGQGHDSWEPAEFPWALMTEPIVGPPYNPSQPAEAKIVALAAGQTVHLSKDFGKTWPTEAALPITSSIFALTFASAKRFFVGTTAGEVFRVDQSGTTWREARLDDVAAGPLGLRGLIADVAIDWTDATLQSIYVAFGGTGDFRHVWHFDGTRWEARSGPGDDRTNLLDVEHNAIVVDRDAPDNVYVGADIGVWHSPDAGQSWRPLPNALPDAPIFDLQMHPTRRLLRAATHGRGLYELRVD
ncbi:MAG TPA: hypothetical protein VMW27_15705 [Thermoanaerobaculia bacterium]|nr:hypothetical protein [Thermoanaerobaculia bacterium]